MFAITGATGQLGRKVIASFKRLHPEVQVVALARDPHKAADLGVPVRQADYAEPASLEAAFAGVDSVLLISSSSLQTRRGEHANVIAAAKRAGVRRVVYTSLLHADRWGIGFAEDHLQTEQWLAESGLAFTILRNGWYWENHTSGLPGALAQGELVGSAGTALTSWAARQDYAEAAVAVLTGNGHDGRIYELAGDNGHSLAELAAEAARQSGRALVYRNLSQAEHSQWFEAIGLPPVVAATLTEMEAVGAAGHLLAEGSRTLSQLIGRPTASLQQAVAEALAG